MKLERLRFANREEWLAGRNRGIGASEAAAIVGMSPWQTAAGLWRLKTGMAKPKDLSGNPAVANGVRMEPALRDFFAALHPEMKVTYHQFDILFQEERPWLFATLDGELTDEKARSGILEIKTAAPNGKAGWEEWADGHMKKAYYVQILHQLLATGYDFVYLFAALYSRNGDITLREYELSREEAGEDLKWLLGKEEEFWKSVENRTLPAVPLTL